MGKIMKPAHFVFQSYWVVPSTWQSFIENGEMACITSAWSSRMVGSYGGSTKTAWHSMENN